MISQIFVDNQDFTSAGFKSLQGVVDSIANLSTILTDLVEIFPDELLLLNELDIAQRFSSELDSLIEAILASIGYIDHLDYFCLQTVIEHVGLVQIVLEISRPSQDKPRDVHFVVSDVILHCQLCDFSDVVVPLLFTQTCKTQSGLSTATVFLRQIHGELVYDVPCITTESTKESTISIHDNESKLLVRLKKFA